MSFLENKLELGIALFTAVLIGGIFSLLNVGGHKLSLGESQVNYEMPRPKNDVVSEFDLQGREIERKFVDPFAQKDQKNQKAETKNNAPQSVKNAAKAQDKKAADKNGKKPQFESRVVGENEQSKLSDGDLIEKTPYQPSVTVNFDNNKPAAQETAKDKDLMSPDQWRALISAQPTKENIAKLVEAFSKKDVDSSTFYQIMKDLLTSQKAETQSLGLTALQSFPAIRSFMVVVQSMEHMDAKVKLAAHDYLLSYNQPKNLGILAMLLQTNDMEVITAAAEVIMDGLSRVKTAQTSNPASGANTAMSTMNDYNRFIPIFQRWQSAQDAQLQGLATTALSQLQAG